MFATWVSRTGCESNGIVNALQAGYTGICALGCAMYWYDSNVQPIKSRSPYMVLLSCLGGYLMITNFAMGHYVTGEKTQQQKENAVS